MILQRKNSASLFYNTFADMDSASLIFLGKTYQRPTTLFREIKIQNDTVKGFIAIGNVFSSCPQGDSPRGILKDFPIHEQL